MPEKQPEASKPNADSKPDADAGAEPAKSGGGWFRLIVVLALAGGSWWAYEAGQLDRYLPSSMQSDPAADAADQQAGSATAQPPDAISLNQPLPAAAQAPAVDDGLFLQVEALDARISTNERNLLQYSSVLERIADEIAATPPGGGEESGASLLAIARLQVELVDVRLRLSGNTVEADAELAALAATIEPSTVLAEQIAANRQQLAQVPSRAQMLSMISDVRNAAGAVADHASAAAAASAAEINQAPGLIGKLFKVTDTQPAAEPPEIALARQAGAAANECARALALGLRQDYLDALSRMSGLAGMIREMAPTALTLQLSAAVAELARFSYPNYALQLANPG